MSPSYTPEEEQLMAELISQYDPHGKDWTEIVHPLTEEQKHRQREWSARMSMVERLECMWEINRRVLTLRGVDVGNPNRPMTVQIVRHDGTVVRQISPKPRS